MPHAGITWPVLPLAMTNFSLQPRFLLRPQLLTRF
jgi:hypothetical protein